MRLAAGFFGLLAAGLAFLPSNVGAQDGSASGLDPATKRAIERISAECALAGMPEEAARVVEMALPLGARDGEVAALRAAVAKVPVKQRAADAERRAIRKRVEGALPALQSALRARLTASSDGDVRTVLASHLLFLDPNDAAGAAAAGRVLHGGRWVHRDAPAMEAASRKLDDQAQRARALDFRPDMRVERTASPTPAHWTEGVTRVAWSDGPNRIAISSGDYPADVLKVVLNQSLRAHALAMALMSGELRPVLGGRDHHLVLFGSRAGERAAFRRALADGRVDPESAPFFEKGAWHWTTDGILHRFDLFPTGVPVGWAFGLGRESCRARYGRRPHAGLCMGALNWACAQVLGTPQKDYLKFGEVQGGGGRYAHDDPAYRKVFLLKDAGFAGMRRWLEFLVRTGAAPPLSDGFQDQLEKIEGDVRTYFTFFGEYLRIRGELDGVIRAASGAADPAACIAAIEAHRNAPAAAQVAEFHDWVVGRGFGRETGLLDRPGFVPRTPDDAELHPGAEDLRKYLNGLRATTLDPEDSEIRFVDADLCAGIEEHLRYLRLNPDQNVWPNAHMQFPDLPGSSPRGARAGLASSLQPGHRVTHRQHADWALGTFYHRLKYLLPDVVAMGSFAGPDGAACDMSSLRRTGESRTPLVLWPAAGAQDVPLSFGQEEPHPVPGEDQGAWGYPVTVQLTDARSTDDAFESARLLLFCKPASPGSAVDGWSIAPDRSFHPDVVVQDTWCFIPKAQLRAKTTFVARLCAGDRVLREWEFTTGSAARPWAR